MEEKTQERKPLSMKQLEMQLYELRQELKNKDEQNAQLYEELKAKVEKEDIKVRYAPLAPEHRTPKRFYSDEEKEAMRIKDRELVAGTFRFYDVADGGGHVKFGFHKWPDDPVEEFLLVDGTRYALPRGVVDHLRENGTMVMRPGMSEIGQADSRKPVTQRRYHFEIENFEEDISALPRGYAPKSNY